MKTRMFTLAALAAAGADLDGEVVVRLNDEVLSATAQAVYAANPNCLIGYSFDNIKLYKLRVKEYKQNHPK